MPSRPTVGVSTSAFFPRPIEATLDLLARQPWRGIELMPQAPSECRPAYAERLLAVGAGRFDFCGIHFPQILAPFLYNPDPSAFAFGQELARDLPDLAGALGARTIVVHGPWANMSEGAFLEATLANLRLMCDVGAGHGVTLALENTPNSPMGASVAAMTSFAAQVARPNFGYTLDTTHTYEMGQELMPYVHGLPSIAHVHASDYDVAAQNRHTAPGHGAIDWHVVIHALAARGFAGNFVLELIAKNLGDDPARTLAEAAALLDPIFDAAYGPATA
ncbi:MAG: sugar phosphate isomerase/epimerase [Trueperaceae bacterium]|nr:sugar phosphate isomerase/epimerase [Trueperaceae bacterium]